jgi:hypothetical protein
MGRRRSIVGTLRVTVAVALVGMLLAIGASGVAADETADGTLITTVDPTPFLHATEVNTDGQSVIWTEVETHGHASGVVTGNLRVVTARLDDRAPFVIQSTIEGAFPGTSYTDLDVSGDAYIWTAQSYDETGVAIDQATLEFASLRSGPWAQLASGPAYTNFHAALDGDWAVWLEGTTTMARNIRSLDPAFVLDDGSQGVFEGVVDRGVIILHRSWFDTEQGVRHERLFTKRIDEPQAPPTLVVSLDDLGYYTTLKYAANGGLVVYSTDFDAHQFGGERMTVWTVDLATGARDRADIDHPYGYHRWLGTDGRYLFAGYGAGVPGASPMSITAYDLGTQSIFPVLTDQAIGGVAIDAQTAVWVTAPSLDSSVREIHASDLHAWLPSAPIAADQVRDPGARWFPQTGHALQLGFFSFWDRNGGLPVFGYPLTEEYVERNPDAGFWPSVQMTERQRFEWHPGNIGTGYEVELGRLGAELLQRQGRDWEAFPTADPTTPHYVAETGHAMPEPFWDYWSAHGLDLGDAGVSYRESLALFGYPLSEPMMETNADGDTVITQYFERAVFEYHPDNSAEYTVLLRRLGAEALVERGWLP